MDVIEEININGAYSSMNSTDHFYICLQSVPFATHVLERSEDSTKYKLDTAESIVSEFHV